MGHRSILGFCERCGQRFDLAQPAPGERDLGLDRVKALFRYCASCQLYVGRSCCWNPDAVACIVDAPPSALSTSQLSGAAEAHSNEVIARRGIAELAASVEATERVGGLPARAPQSDEDREIGRRAWEDAWWATAWLIARAETSRDAAAKALRRVSAQPDASAADGMTGQLSSLVEMYGRARAMVEASLVTAGKSLARRDRHKPFLALPRRVEPAIIGTGALVAVVVLAFGAATLLQLGYLNPFAPSGDAVASHPDAAVLGGAGGPGPSKSAASTPASQEPGAVIARLDFDELRIGPLAGASDDIGPVAGGPEVVAFPSPFDRSIRVVGDGSYRFCMPILALHGDRIVFIIDLYAETPIASGRLMLSMAPSDAGPTAASVPLELLRGLESQAWHRLRVAWAPGQPVAIAIGDSGGEEMQTVKLPPANDAQAVSGAVCATVSGMAKSAELLLDNVRVKQ